MEWKLAEFEICVLLPYPPRITSTCVPSAFLFPAPPGFPHCCSIHRESSPLLSRHSLLRESGGRDIHSFYIDRPSTIYFVFDENRRILLLLPPPPRPLGVGRN